MRARVGVGESVTGGNEHDRSDTDVRHAHDVLVLLLAADRRRSHDRALSLTAQSRGDPVAEVREEGIRETGHDQRHGIAGRRARAVPDAAHRVLDRKDEART